MPTEASQEIKLLRQQILTKLEEVKEILASEENGAYNERARACKLQIHVLLLK